MTARIFIDGAAGTTGLLIHSLLKPWEAANKISLIAIADYKDTAQRKAAFAQADLSVLCLPDGEARKAIPLLQNTGTRVIDASSAHRVSAGWVYGLPELDDNQRRLIAAARFVSNPGCFATGAIAALRPLVRAGLIDQNQSVPIMGAAGYSAGGKKLITQYESIAVSPVLSASSLNARHKHIDEIKIHAGLKQTPLFLPHVLNVARGMMVSMVFNRVSLWADPAAVQKILEEAYSRPDSKVHVAPLDLRPGRLAFETAATDSVTLHVKGWRQGAENQLSIHALLDNLGKGAAAQALQNIQLILDL